MGAPSAPLHNRSQSHGPQDPHRRRPPLVSGQRPRRAGVRGVRGGRRGRRRRFRAARVLPAAPGGGAARRPASRHRRVRRLPADHRIRGASDRDHDLEPRRLGLRAARDAPPGHAGSCPRPSSRGSACRSCWARDRTAARARARRDRGHRRRARRPGDRALVRPRRQPRAHRRARAVHRLVVHRRRAVRLVAPSRQPLRRADDRGRVRVLPRRRWRPRTRAAVHGRGALLEPLHRGLRPHAARLSRRAGRLAAAAPGAGRRLRALDRRPGARAAVRRPRPADGRRATCPTRRSTSAPTR